MLGQRRRDAQQRQQPGPQRLVGEQQGRQRLGLRPRTQLDEGLQITTRDGSTIYANAQFDAILGNDAQDKPRAPEELLADEPVAAE